MTDINDQLAAHRRSQQPSPAPPPANRIKQAVAKSLAALRPDPAGTVAVAELVASARRALPSKYRKRLLRREVIDALADLGIPVGLLDRRQVIVGFAADVPPVLIVDASGKVRAA